MNQRMGVKRLRNKRCREVVEFATIYGRFKAICSRTTGVYAGSRQSGQRSYPSGGRDWDTKL